MWNLHVVLLEVMAISRLEMDNSLNADLPECPVLSFTVSLCDRLPLLPGCALVSAVPL